MIYPTSNWFPVNALPSGFRDAIMEVQVNVQVPIELAVASALGALSLACQDQINVQRPNGLESPCSLYLVTIADSGERKTSCDKLFTKPLRDMEVSSEIATEVELEQYDADLMAWSLQTKALESRLLKSKKRDGANANLT